jgi:tetratricopeptide (TPR) repeat protein
MTRLGKIEAAFVGGCLAIFISTGTAATNAPEEKINLEIEAAREMINSWSGQSQILDQAREKLARVLEAAPQNYLALKEMSRYQIAAGYINSRMTQYETHIYQTGNYTPGTLERAEATIREAIRVNPRFAEGYVLLGYIQFEQTKLDEAAKTLAQAETLGTDDPWLHLNWAMLHNARGDYSAANERWQRVLQSGTSNNKAKLAAYGFLIESYKRSGEQDKVIALYKDQLKLNPSNAWLRGNFAEYLSETLGRNDEAITQAHAALEIMNYGVGQRILAMALYRKWADMVTQGNEIGAEKYFQEAWENYPQLNDVMAYGASVPTGERLAKALITKKGVSIDARAEDGSTALLIATNRNRAQTVKALLDLNADPNIHDTSGWTPLLSAADEGNTEIVSMLLAKGADIGATLQGSNAAALAESRGKAELAALLRKRATELK